MSQTIAAPPRAPDQETREVIDSLGRRLELRKLDVMAELDLIEAAGLNADNRRWMMLATLAACVRSIDGVPCIMPRSRGHIRAHVGRVRSEGIAAVAEEFSEKLPDDDDDAAAEPSVGATAKKSLGTPASA